MLAATAGDFNGDGRDDLAIGSALESLPDAFDPNGKVNAGAVNVIYGGEAGLTPVGNQFWHQDAPGIDGVAAPYEAFGSALAAGDFNNDGFDDLAIGVVGQAVDGKDNCGAVHIIYGSTKGLRATGDQLWTQNSTGINDAAQIGDLFGNALAAGDFDGDGCDDLAIGVAAEDVSELLYAGAVNVLYGSQNGLTSSGDQFWHQDVAGIDGVPGALEAFGFSLAAGDFNHDGRDDLAIGTRQDTVSGFAGAGAANVIYGSAAGLAAAGDQLLHQDTSGVNDRAEPREFFGHVVAAGDTNGDGFDDLAVGAPGEAGVVGVTRDSGMVHVLFGGRAKLSGKRDVSLTRFDFPSIAAKIGTLGLSVAIGHFNDDAFADLTFGAPVAEVNGFSGAGLVVVLPGSAVGSNASSAAQLWSQGASGILETAEYDEAFGSTLAAGDFNGDGRDDLSVAACCETLALSQEGIVHIIYGSQTGLSGFGNQTFAQGVDGLFGDQEFNDFFGRS
jgi:hypothetical protein